MNKSLQILVKVHTSEYYDEVSHAVVYVTLDLVNFLSAKIRKAKQFKSDGDFYCLTFFNNDVEFMDFCDFARCGYDATSVGEVALGESGEEKFESDLECGYRVLPNDFEVTGDESRPVRPMMLRVMDNRFYWEGFDKYVGPAGHVETDSFNEQALDEWRSELGGDVPEPHPDHVSKLTWAGLSRMIGEMSSERQQDDVTLYAPNDEFYPSWPGFQVVHTGGLGDGILDEGHCFLRCDEGAGNDCGCPDCKGED